MCAAGNKRQPKRGLGLRQPSGEAVHTTSNTRQPTKGYCQVTTKVKAREKVRQQPERLQNASHCENNWGRLDGTGVM